MNQSKSAGFDSRSRARALSTSQPNMSSSTVTPVVPTPCVPTFGTNIKRRLINHNFNPHEAPMRNVHSIVLVSRMFSEGLREGEIDIYSLHSSRIPHPVSRQHSTSSHPLIPSSNQDIKRWREERVTCGRASRVAHR